MCEIGLEIDENARWARVERYKAMIDASPDGVVEFDPDGLVIGINPAFEKMYGFTLDELRNKPLEVLLPRMKPGRTRDTITAAGRVEETVHETQRLTRDGKLLDIRLYISGSKILDGKPAGFFEIHTDITQQKRTEKINKTLYAISRAVHSTPSLDDLYKSIHESLAGIIDTTNIFISSYDRENDIITCPYFIDEYDEPYHIADAQGSKSLNAVIIQTKKPLLLNEDRLQSLSDAGEIRVVGTSPKSWLGVPLIVRNEVIGAIAVQSYTTVNQYHHRDVELLESISQQIALAIERKQAEARMRESEEKYRTIFEQSRDAIYITSPDGEPVIFNQSTLDFFGLTLQELTEVKIEDIYVDPAERERNNKLLEQNGYIKDCEIRLKRSDGREIICLDTATIWRGGDGTVKGYIGALRDITELRQTEAALRKAKEEAEAATRSKSEFLANMSHEIRSPMNAIIGLAHLALKTGLTEKQRDYLTKINTASNSLLGIINDILDFSKIEAGRLRMEAVNFHFEDVLNNLRNLIGVKAEEKGLELMFRVSEDVPPELVGDPLRLGQVLLNLTTNAIKFTNQGHVIVKVEREPQPDRDHRDTIVLKFSVQDTGIGMTGEQMDKLFEAFSQADTSITRKFGGTGLGLVISRSLVEMMNGHIQVESESGRGSTFSFTAGFGLQSEIMDRIQSCPESIMGMRVLVVDDNPVAREIICEAMESFSFKTAQVSSGLEAIAEIENAEAEHRPYDLVIMDWRMQGMDGIEASRRIKFESNLAQIPYVVMVTAYGKEEVIKEARKAGIDGYLVKPVDRSLLLNTILEVLGLKMDHSLRSTMEEPMEIDGLENIRGARILLAEDIEINQQVATELLEDAGFAVTVAENGREAVDRFTGMKLENDTLYDVILMDIQMPEMDGYSATREIRDSDSEFRGIPIIAMTAHAMSGEREKCLAAGMNDHIAKPIDPERLFSTLVKWVKPGPRKTAPKASKDGPETGEVILPLDLPGIDLNAGLARVAGNKKLLLELLLKLDRKHSQVDIEIQEALEARDTNTAKNLAHMIKGMAGNLGATKLHQTAAHLEKTILKNDTALIQTVWNDFSEALRRTTAIIQTIEDRGREEKQPPQESSSVDIEETTVLLSELDRLISSDYGQAIDRIGTLKNILGNTEVSDGLDDLERYLDEFNEEEARLTLQNIARTLGIVVKG